MAIPGHSGAVLTTSTTCATCGNVYDKAFQVVFDGRNYSFDCFECAIHALAPVCSRCGCRVIGHGVEVAGVQFCGASCTRQSVSAPVVDRL